MIRTIALGAALLGLAAVIALDAPSQGGAPSATVTYASEPRTLPSVCPGAQTVPVGDIQSGDAELGSGSTDVAFDVLPPGGEVIDQGTAFEQVGSSLERIGSGDIAGLAGLTCPPTSGDQWLVGGSTALGSSARLVLSNPADTPVSAEVALHTPVGAVDGATSVVIGPGAQRTLLLEGIEPEMPSVAVRVTAGGLGVSAALQDSRLDGFTPAGTDWVTPSDVGQELAVLVPAESDGEARATLALISPEGAQVELAMAGEQGAVPWIGESSLTLEAGVLTEVPIPQAGSGTVLIDATGPVTAAARVEVPRSSPSRGGDTAYDIAWTGSQLRGQAGERAVVVPPGNVALQVHGDEAGVVVFDAAGSPLDVTVTDETTARVSVGFEPGTLLSSTSEASWSLVVTDEPGFITTLEPVSIELSSVDTEVTVDGRYPVPVTGD
ncbi:DUF5719 family protein [Demequina sp. SO4-13]|uniref:DUF5719 family protein n=1 Tax=Demequina sp. SO4-13 TaxID=3401027 RepID=UPI003AF53D5E